MFSDLNNLKVVTVTSEEYGDCFGFTEEEVSASMDEFGLVEKGEVCAWYDGFAFGKKRSIYNPWSIINYLDKRQFRPYWANTSSNSLVGKLVREGIPAAVIGTVSEGIGREICYGPVRGFLERPREDELYRIWKQEEAL